MRLIIRKVYNPYVLTTRNRLSVYFFQPPLQSNNPCSHRCKDIFCINNLPCKILISRLPAAKHPWLQRWHSGPFCIRLLDKIDVLVDGRFEIEKSDTSYEWAGSTNQRVLRKESNFTINTSEIYDYSKNNIFESSNANDICPVCSSENFDNFEFEQ